jgi:hypothetical protein
VLFDDLLDGRVFMARRDHELAQGRYRTLVVRDRELDPASAGGIVALAGEWDRFVVPDSTGLLKRDPSSVVGLERLFVPVCSGKTVTAVTAHNGWILPGGTPGGRSAGAV